MPGTGLDGHGRPFSFPIFSAPTAIRATPSSWPSGCAGGASTPRWSRSAPATPCRRLRAVRRRRRGGPAAGAGRPPARSAGPRARCAGRSTGRRRAGRVRRDADPRHQFRRTRRRRGGRLGLVDCATRRGPGPRAVGEIVVEPVPELALPALSGYENHAGRDLGRPGASRSWAGSGSGSATATGRGQTVCGPGGSSEPTCTVRCWPATRPWRTSCSGGWWATWLRSTTTRSWTLRAGATGRGGLPLGRTGGGRPPLAVAAGGRR